MALAAWSVDHEQSIHQDHSVVNVNKPVNQQPVNNKSTATSQVLVSSAVGNLQRARSLPRYRYITNLQFETLVAEVLRASHDLVKAIGSYSCLDHTLAYRSAGKSELSYRALRRWTVSSGRKFFKPSVPFPTEQVLARRTSVRSICAFKKRCPGEPSGYRWSPRTATDRSPECQRTILPASKGEQSAGEAFKALSWRSPTVQQIPERRTSKTSRARDPDTSNLASSVIRSNGGDIGFDISKRHQ